MTRPLRVRRNEVGLGDEAPTGRARRPCGRDVGSGDELHAAVDAVARLPPTRGPVLRLLADALDYPRVHDGAAYGAMPDRRIAPDVIHVVAGVRRAEGH